VCESERKKDRETEKLEESPKKPRIEDYGDMLARTHQETEAVGIESTQVIVKTPRVWFEGGATKRYFPDISKKKSKP
jgi:predicted component of viral defense system (DUF524 family)